MKKYIVKWRVVETLERAYYADDQTINQVLDQMKDVLIDEFGVNCRVYIMDVQSEDVVFPDDIPF